MFDTLKLVFDTFGKDLMVPVMIFIICMIFKAPAKKAFSWLEMAQICAIGSAADCYNRTEPEST